MPPKKRGPVGGDQGPVPDHVQMAIHVSVKRFLESDEDGEHKMVCRERDRP